MKLDKTILSTFLKVLSLKNDAENKEALLAISPNNIKVLTTNPTKTVVFRGTLKGEYEDVGTIGIDSLSLLRNFVDSFEKDITISKVSNKLVLKEKGLQIQALLRSPQYIVNKLDETKFDTIKENISTSSIVLAIEDIKKIVTYCGTLNSDNIVLESLNGKLILKTEKNENEILATIDVAIKDSFTVKFGKILIDVLSVLADYNIKIYLKDNAPAYLLVENDDYTFEILVAPKKKN